jgi:hypothetical protein
MIRSIAAAPAQKADASRAVATERDGAERSRLILPGRNVIPDVADRGEPG